MKAKWELLSAEIPKVDRFLLGLQDEIRCKAVIWAGKGSSAACREPF